MNSEIMIEFLGRLNRRMRKEHREIILFLDYAGCYPVSLQGMFSSIKIVFLPPNTTSRLQALDAGIIKYFINGIMRMDWLCYEGLAYLEYFFVKTNQKRKTNQ